MQETEEMEESTLGVPVFKVKEFQPYGRRLLENCPLYCEKDESSMHRRDDVFITSIGESSPSHAQLKLHSNFPKLTEEDEEREKEILHFFTTEMGFFKELYVNRDICIVSEGPIGGPSKVKQMFRPQTAHEQAHIITNVVFAKFGDDKEDEQEEFLCLVEKFGLSLFGSDTIDSHVVYTPEFQIANAIACKHGLLVIPIRSGSAYSNDEKFLYLLSHPVKQVSRLWIKHTAKTDFLEYDRRNEDLVFCKNDICIFWSLKNDRIIGRKLLHFSKDDVANITAPTNSPSLLTQNLADSNLGSSYCNYNRIHTRSCSRLLRDKETSSTSSIWSNLDFSVDSSGPAGAAFGFYPAHMCVYDEPEVYLTNIFNLDLNPKNDWTKPVKTFSSCIKDRPFCLGLWTLVKSHLYLFAVNLSNGSKSNHFALKNVRDFQVSCNEIPFIIVLNADFSVHIGWLDNNFSIAASGIIDFKHNLAKLNAILSSNIIVGEEMCSRKGDEKFFTFSYKCYDSHELVRRCVSKFHETLPFEFVVKVVADYSVTNGSIHGGACDEEPVKLWENFSDILIVLLKEEIEANPRSKLPGKVYNVIRGMQEDDETAAVAQDSMKEFKLLAERILESCFEFGRPDSMQSEWTSHFQLFCKLLKEESPSLHSSFVALPEVMKILLKDPDSVESLATLAEFKESNISFAPIIELLIIDIFNRNKTNAQFDWPKSVLKQIGRYDYLCGSNESLAVLAKIDHEANLQLQSGTEIECEEEDPEWTSHVLNLRIFAEDRRLEEVCKLLDSASPLTIDVQQRAEMSDHEYVEEQEKQLLQLVQISFSAPVGRAAFTLMTELQTFTNLTNVIKVPKLCQSGACAFRGTSVELNESELPSSYNLWPNFHNAVAAALAVKFSEKPAEAWFGYNKSKAVEGPQQAGIVLGFGLNGILKQMPPTLRHEYLAKENSFTTMAMLLGLSANLAGSGDMSTWKIISLHIGAMLPACTTEMEIPKLATLVAPCALGLLFIGTHNSHVGKVLLGEISKRYNPLSIFGSSLPTAHNPTSDSSAVVGDREAHSLCSGFGLGFVHLGKGRVGSFQNDDFDGMLRRFVVGGPKPSSSTGGQWKLMMGMGFIFIQEENSLNQYSGNMPSIWEEYRCCHIEEGDNVNIDVTTPSAIIAVSLIYLKSGNEAVLKWLAPPPTLHLLDGVRPDILLLRSLASVLVLEHIVSPVNRWVETKLVPRSLQAVALKEANNSARLDLESVNQAWVSIISGACLGLGIRYAGTSDTKVEATLWHYMNKLLDISSPESKFNEYFPKNFLDSSLCTVLMSLALLLAGTGKIKLLKLCRYLQSKVGSAPVTSSSNTYGLQMSISLSTGFLFLGGGRYSLANDDRSIAVLLASVFPKWPVNANDNRYHLQALRHLYVLAAEPRLIIPRPVPHSIRLFFFLKYTNGHCVRVAAPVLLPPFELLSQVYFYDPDYLPVLFELPRDLVYLRRLVNCGGYLNVIKKPIGLTGYNFVKQMEWRDKRLVDPSFYGYSENECSMRGDHETLEYNMIHRVAEWHGVPDMVYPVLELRNSDASNPSWIWQIRILYWWKCISSKSHKSSIPYEFLSLLLNKCASDFEVFINPSK